MNSTTFVIIPGKGKLILVLMAITGFLFLFVSTGKYGAGLSPDSVRYIATARNISSGLGAISYGGPLTVHAPMYPTLLALLSYISGTDPLSLAPVVNALIFGIIIYLSGLLAFRYLHTSLIFALLVPAAVLVSMPLFEVSVMAWTESLFICFLLLAVIFSNSYLEKRDLTSLSVLSVSVALAFMTRYIGATLVLWSILVILFCQRNDLLRKTFHLFFFILFSVTPMGIWVIRNYLQSGTLFGGYRGASIFTLSQNLSFTFDTFYDWYIPDEIGDHRAILIILSLIIGFFAIRSLKCSWRNVKFTLIKISPVILLVIIYTSSVVFISTTTSLEQIGNRYLSPVYVPLTILALIFLLMIFEPSRQLFLSRMANVFLIVGVSIWLVSQLWGTISFARDYMKVGGGGYNSKSWRESKTIQHALQNKDLAEECAVYSNDPYALYILANLRGKFSPEETEYNSPDVANTISTLKGRWPKEDKACLIWFNNEDRTYLFTIDELHTIANLHQVIRLSDGMIYYATRK